MIEAWVSMWNSYDLNLIDKLFLNDDRLTYFSSERQGIIRGLDAVRKHHEAFGFVKGGKVQLNKLWLEDTQTEIFDRVAVVKSIWCFKKENSEEVRRGPVTLVYFRTYDEYRIAHAHFSNY